MFADFDDDIKIAGDKPSKSVLENRLNFSSQPEADTDKKRRACMVGEDVANLFFEDMTRNNHENESNAEMVLQRRVLLSFTATVGFERYLKDDALVGFAQKAFLDSLKKKSREIYTSSTDTGAFSFYYLAFRRGLETERRMGQTFAMLCSHDGDPIFQELGEALYCWFSAEVKRVVKERFGETL